MAELGVGILIIPQKPWDEVAKELDDYRDDLPRGERRRGAAADLARAGPSATRTPTGRASMARRYIGGYFQTVLDHYEFEGDHLGKTKGYEYYGKMAEKITHVRHRHGDRLLRRTCRCGARPSSATTKILDIRRRVGNEHFVGVFSYAGMPYDEAERNMRLFAAEVMPALSRVGEEAPALSHTA